LFEVAMLITRAYKTRLVVNNRQASYLGRCAGAARFVYNWALADRKQRYETEALSTNKFEQKRRFNGLKHEQFPWLADVPYTIVEQVFENIDRAFTNFFRRVKAGEKPGYPRFKSRHKSTPAFTLRGAIHVERDRIQLPRIGWLRLAERDYLPIDGCKVLSANISEQAGQWYVCLQVEQDIPDPEPPTGDPLGVDVGLKVRAAISDGAVFDNQRPLDKAQRKLARLQRELSRRKIGSANRAKTKAKVARMHKRVADIRRHNQHQVSRYVVDKGPRAVVIEDLNVKGMQKNHCLARSVADSGMGELRRQIEYKAAWAGIEVIKADRWYPSTKTCSACGAIKEVTLDERVYRCPECGLVIDRDLNAARNLAALANPENAGGLPGELQRLGCTVNQEAGNVNKSGTRAGQIRRVSRKSMHVGVHPMRAREVCGHPGRAGGPAGCTPCARGRFGER